MRWFVFGLFAVAVVIALFNLKKLGTFLEAAKRFYHEVMVEGKKVSWPTKDHVVNSTLLVGVATLVMMVVVGSIDNFFTWVVSLIFI